MLKTRDQLKEATYKEWVKLHKYQDKVYNSTSPAADEYFKSKVRQMLPDGITDLRKRETWEYAFAAIKAMVLWEANADNHDLVSTYLIGSAERKTCLWSHLVPKIVLFLAQTPETLYALGQGIAANLQYGGAEWNKLKDLFMLITQVAPLSHINQLAEGIDTEDVSESQQLTQLLEEAVDGRRKSAIGSVRQPCLAAVC